MQFNKKKTSPIKLKKKVRCENQGSSYALTGHTRERPCVCFDFNSSRDLYHCQSQIRDSNLMLSGLMERVHKVQREVQYS